MLECNSNIRRVVVPRSNNHSDRTQRTEVRDWLIDEQAVRQHQAAHTEKYLHLASIAPSGKRLDGLRRHFTKQDKYVAHLQD